MRENRGRNLFTLGVAYSIVLMFGACSSDTDKAEICLDSASCGEGYQCVVGACLREAALGGTCDAASVCLEGRCTDGICRAGTADPVCVTAGDCRAGKTCVEGRCVEGAKAGEPCDGQVLCAREYRCMGNPGVCKVGVEPGGDCSLEWHACLAGVCRDGICRLETQEDKEKSTDTDGDGISDYYDRCDEDTDGDTIPNCKDFDSDGDGIPDRVESGATSIYDEPVDSDMDGVPDFLDLDSDGNGLPDAYEGCYAEKQKPLACVQDSDCAEGAHCGTGGICFGGEADACEAPVDTDGDGIADYRSLDNDGDGMLDIVEISGFSLIYDGGYVPARMCGAERCVYGSAADPWDTDGDGVADYLSPDSDGDTIPDRVEGELDSDGDTVADRYSLDSDGDGILDSVEYPLYLKFVNTDGTETLCYLSSDCDGDGLADNLEVTCDPELYPMNGGTSITSPDKDGDGYADAAEYAAAVYAAQQCEQDESRCILIEDPSGEIVRLLKPEQLICDPMFGVNDVFDFYFELKYRGDTQNAVLDFRPTVSKLDLVINLDVTSSMQAEIDNIKQKLSTTIIPGVRQRVEDSSFAISAFADFPVAVNADIHYGAPEENVRNGQTYQPDVPWKLLQKSTKDTGLLNAAVQQFTLTAGFDHPEAGYESLWQIAGADRVSPESQTRYRVMKDCKNGDGCTATDEFKALDIVANEAGHWGGAGFREGTLPIVVHITDAPSHGSEGADMVKIPGTDTVSGLLSYAYNTEYVKNSRTNHDVHKLYQSRGIRLLSVYRRSAADAADEDKQHVAAGAQHPVLYDSSLQTDAVVPACAFKTASGWRCGSGDGARCCTVNTDLGYVVPEADGCVLSYGIENGGALSDTVVDGIDALVKYGTYDVAARVVGAPFDVGVDVEPTCLAKDTSSFIERVEAKAYIAPPQEPEHSCNPQAVPARFNDAAYDNGFKEFATGTSSSAVEGAKLSFTVYASNRCVKPKTEAQTFSAQIEVYNPTTGLVFGTRQVYVIVPGERETVRVN